MSGINIQLPWPPTVNTYWRCTMVNGKPRVLMSVRGRQYRKDALYAITMQGAVNVRLSGSVSISIDLYPPDKRKRDIDNVIKSILDVLTHGGVWIDDSQVSRLSVSRCEQSDRGHVELTITEM